MAERTNVKSLDDFSIFTSLLEYNGVIGEWSDDIFDGRYYECLEHMKSGGYGYFEVDYDIPEVIISKFIMI